MYIPIPNNRCSASRRKRAVEPIAVLAPIIGAVASALFAILLPVFNHGGGNVSPDSHPPVAQFITKSARTRIADMRGDWRFSVGDDAQWSSPAFDASSWSAVDVPSRWESEGFRGYDGFAWYRRTFRIPDTDVAKALYLDLGRVDDVDEVFVNGTRIGGEGHFPPAYVTAWNRKRVYRIPAGLARAGDDNLIAVRVYDDQQGGGIVSGKVGIYASDLPQPLLDLSGDWTFRTGDDPSWRNVNIDESGFRPIQVPMVWEAEGWSGYDGYGWYRKSFGKIPVSRDETLVLVLGKIDDTDEVFLNGERIGQTGKLDASDRAENDSYYILDRAYAFPADLLEERNVLAVRVHDDLGYGGIYSGPVGIMTKSGYDDYLDQLEKSRKWNLGKTIDWLLGRD